MSHRFPRPRIGYSHDRLTLVLFDSFVTDNRGALVHGIYSLESGYARKKEVAKLIQLHS